MQLQKASGESKTDGYCLKKKSAYCNGCNADGCRSGEIGVRNTSYADPQQLKENLNNYKVVYIMKVE